MLKSISNLPNLYNLFTLKDFPIYTLCCPGVPGIRKALYQKVYVFNIMGGGIKQI